ncbi:MAG: FAD:protein FMN transferase [Ilumatobacteraceae bacterium]
MEVVEHRFRVMASEGLVAVTVPTDDSRRIDAAGLVRRAVAELCHLEARWSRFLPDSDVSVLNLAEGRPVRVDRDTITLIATMQEASRETTGSFDPTVLPDLVAAGYRFSIVDPARGTVLPASSSVPVSASMADIEIDVARSQVRLPLGIAIDPGGIGKGLAADLTVAMLIEAGASGALVSIGGDMAMAGAPPHPDGWAVAVERTNRDEGDLCTLAVAAGGVATSSTTSRSWRSGGSTLHHVIDPATGQPSTTDLAAVTVSAGTGWAAEAHATAALLAGSQGAIAHLEANGLSGIAQSIDGRVVATRDLGMVLPTEACA